MTINTLVAARLPIKAIRICQGRSGPCDSSAAPHCCSADGSAADENRTAVAELPRSAHPARVKERNNPSCDRIDSRQVGALAKVVAMAGEREVGKASRAAMLACDDVLDL